MAWRRKMAREAQKFRARISDESARTLKNDTMRGAEKGQRKPVRSLVLSNKLVMAFRKQALADD